MSFAVTVPGPCFFTTMRLGPSPCILMAISLMLSTMSVTSSRTPAIEENSCSTPSMWTDCTAAPCSDDNKIRRSALPSVTPKPRSSGSATTVATRRESAPALTCNLLGLISSCQFFWIVTLSPIALRGATMSRGSLRSVRPRSCGGRCSSWSISRMSYTRRRLRGRQPLCGIGVTSRIEVMVKPAACSERSADSRPEPGPATSTSSVRMPCSCAFLAASSAATCAAYGVDLREPLKPIVPADDQAIALPCTSVMVIMVLLNDAFTCATPEAMFFRSRRRTRVASLPILNPFGSEPAAPVTVTSCPFDALFLLAGDRLGRSFAGPGVGVGPLPANRQATAVTQPAIAAEIHQPLDVHRHFAPQIALDDVVAVDHFAQLQNLLIGQLRHPARLG